MSKSVATRRTPKSKKRVGADKRLNVILKVCNSCNAACTFCSIGPSGKMKMSLADFEFLVGKLERLIENRRLEHLKLTFHGGEPTMMGADWYDKACALASKLPVGLQFNMQSNLISFPLSMIDVSLRYGIRVGSSIDPLFGERRTLKNKDAFPAWLETYQRLNEAGMRVHPIFVVTAKALNHPEKLYQIAESLGSVTSSRFVLQVNPVYPQGKASAADGLLMEPEDLGRYFVELISIWNQRGRSVRLLPIENFYHLFAGGKGLSFPCTFGGNCTWSHVGVNYDLRVAGCGRRLDSEKYMGSLRTDEFVDILENSEENIQIRQRTDCLKKGPCKGCEFFNLCRGGCPDDAELTAGDFMNPHYYCKGWKLFFKETRNSAETLCSEPEPLNRVRIKDADMPIVVGTDPDYLGGDFRTDRANGAHEKWLLPTEDDDPLRVDTPLQKLLGRGVRMLRIWVENHRVSSLEPWRNLLHSPVVRVVLFQTEGLEKASLFLDRLGATIIHYLPTIAGKENWDEEVRLVLKRFLHDSNWKSQVYPYTWMLANTIHKHAAPISDRWGMYPAAGKIILQPGLYEAVHPSELLGEIESLEKSAARGGGSWLRLHRKCLECSFFRICGAHLAPDRGPCSKKLQSLAETIYKEGQKLLDEIAGDQNLHDPRK